MKNGNRGFTIYEIVITLVISSVSVSIGMENTTAARQRCAANSALRMYSALQSRARAHAIERGSNAHLSVDVVRDQVSISVNGDTLETIRFVESMGVALEADVPSVELYFTPRGYADPDLNSFLGSVTIDFVKGQARSSVVVHPLGQITGS